MGAFEDLMAVDLGELKSEVKNLRAIKAWAIESLGVDYTTGDRVEIISPKPSESTGGWAAYSEALAVGRTGEAGEISFNCFANRWDVHLHMDRAWSTSSWGDGERIVRYWKGPADETPQWFEPPSVFDQQRYPDGKIKIFAMPVTWLRKVP